jgi:hypothetical protein
MRLFFPSIEILIKVDSVWAFIPNGWFFLSSSWYFFRVGLNSSCAVASSLSERFPSFAAWSWEWVTPASYSCPRSFPVCLVSSTVWYWHLGLQLFCPSIWQSSLGHLPYTPPDISTGILSDRSPSSKYRSSLSHFIALSWEFTSGYLCFWTNIMVESLFELLAKHDWVDR